jgi:carbonic anhydrase
MFRTVSILALLIGSASAAKSAKYDYDSGSDVGPQNWGNLSIADNQCGGNIQSGIDVPTGACDETNADYVFNVSSCVTQKRAQ